MGSNLGLKRTLNEFEITLAIFLTDWTYQSKPTNSKSFLFFCFSVLFVSLFFCTICIKFGIWTANAPTQLLLLPCACLAPGLLLACSQPAPGLLMVWSCPAPGPAFGSLHHHQHFTTFTTFFGTVRAAFYGRGDLKLNYTSKRQCCLWSLVNFYVISIPCP